MVDRFPPAPDEFDGPSAPGVDEAAGAGHDDAAYRAAFERAVGLLAQREHSVRELTAKLASRGVAADTARLVVDDLRGRGLQSDERFAEAFVHARVGRGQGPVRIRRELAERGIHDDVADQLLTQPAEYWLERAQAVRARKFGAALPAERRDWNRQARFLAQRGFPADLIYRMLGGRD
jgi:regulatory protein